MLLEPFTPFGKFVWNFELLEDFWKIFLKNLNF
jgi:hypothetical protein